MKDKLFHSQLLISSSLPTSYCISAFGIAYQYLPFYLSEEIFNVGETHYRHHPGSYTVACIMYPSIFRIPYGHICTQTILPVGLFHFYAMFAGYIIAGSLTLFILLCELFTDVAFGMVTVGGNTVVIDIMPSSRRGEGLGYYGLSNNIAMAIGPMAGLFLHDAGIPYTTIFSCSLDSSIAGFIMASLVQMPV